MTGTFSLDEALRFTSQLAAETGSLLLENLRKGPTYRLKSSHQDLVTESDKAAENLIVGRIQKKYPDHGILSEESPEYESAGPFRWVIDPIDGTTNFAHGIPFFCTSIALEQDGKLVVGVIYDPIREELFAASAGGEASLNGEPIKVSATEKLPGALLGFGYPFKTDLLDQYVRQMRDMLPLAQGLRRLGSAALCLAYVAAGRLDGYWDLNLNRWDLAAGALLVDEAGGRITDFKNRSLRLNTTSVAATNSKIHDELLKVVGD